MTNDLQHFAEQRDAYLSQIPPGTHQTARELHFYTWVKEAFDLDLSSLKLEERVYGGQIDALLGRLVFEFKTDWQRELSDAEDQLRRYITQLRNQHSGALYTAVATDGIRFRLYEPLFAGDGVTVIALNPLAERDLERQRDPWDTFLWFDALFRHLTQDKVEPTTQNMVAAFGPASPSFQRSASTLARLYRGAADDPMVQVRFNEWRKYLAIVYGDEVGSQSLFLKHTYLATIAKLIALFRLRPTALLPSDQEMTAFLKGQLFSQWGIANFIEDDFFTWFLALSVRAEGLGLLRRLTEALSHFDFSLASEDVLKELYEQLVDPEDRHDLGEYYTPDWLAEYILAQELKLPEDPQRSILDPACGSGTFLFIAIRLVRQALLAQGLSPFEALTHILADIVGVDVHPVAVLTARTNYLLALGDLLDHRKDAVTVPVYLADTLRPLVSSAEQPRPLVSGAKQPLGDGYEEPVYTIGVEGESFAFELPESAITDPSLLDRVVEQGIRPYLLTPASAGTETLPASTRQGLLVRLQNLGLSPFASAVLVDQVAVPLFQLIQEGKDTVWLFILKNLPKPTFLSRRKFDLVVGNPPWLSMRYIRNPTYYNFVRSQVLQEYELLERSKPHLFTHLELSTLFYARSADLYLKDGGAVAFVMPRGVMGYAQQHQRFTLGVFKNGTVALSPSKILDLEAVEPLFRVPACVFIARKGQWPNGDVPGTVFSGTLPRKNAPWTNAQPHLTLRPTQYRRVQGRFTEGVQAPVTEGMWGKSYYADKFYQGATLVPRALWFVQPTQAPFAPIPQAPVVESSQQAVQNAKKPWDTVHMRLPIEAQFLFATLPSGDLVPFGYTRFTPVVLPAVREGNRLALLNRDGALERGFPLLAAWITEAERIWAGHARRDAQSQLRIMTALERLNRNQGLTRQDLSKRYRVVYARSGTNLASAMLDTSHLPFADIQSLAASAFIADNAVYYYETNNSQEAVYLAAVLNARTIDTLIKPLQSRGLWGERDIHKKVWQLRIPQYNPQDSIHQRLVVLGQACHAKVSEAIQELSTRTRSVARLRAQVRNLVQDELQEIDALVRQLLGLA